MSNYHRFITLRHPPADIQAFFEETAAGLNGLYGPAAAAEYLANAPTMLRASLGHPSVHAFAAVDGNDTTRALLMAVMKPPIAHVVYVHTLAAYTGDGIESDLLDHALQRLKAMPIEGIVSEYISFEPQDVEAVFVEHGFTPEGRALMLAPLDAPELHAPPEASSYIAVASDWDDAADILVDAYRDHPGRHLHLEVRDKGQARSFLRAAEGGGYGIFQPAFARLHPGYPSGIADGMIIGSRVAPGVGFVMHVAVRPNARGAGIGTHLLLDLVQAFREAGYDRVGLGVTDDNPARRLYDRLGFKTQRSVTAWYWWR